MSRSTFLTDHPSPLLQWATANLTEILIAGAIAAGIVVLLLGARALMLRTCKRLGSAHPFAATLANAARKTRWWFMVALAVRLVDGYLHPPEDVAKTVAFVFTVATAMQVAIWVRSLILGIIEHRAMGHDGDPTTLTSAMSLIKVLVSAAVFAIAAIVVLDNLGANVSALIAGLGVGGIAIGLAAQGIFADLFAALSIIFDKPFRIGDTITFQGKEGPVTGTVQKIGLKSTRIRALTGELRIIGNTQLLAQEVTNFRGRRLFRQQLPIGVIYQTDPALLAEIPSLLQAAVERAGARYVYAWLKGFGPSSIDYDFLFEVDTGDNNEAHDALQAIALDVLNTFKERGIEFAYPTQTTFTAAPDGTMIMPYPPPAPPREKRPAS